MSRRRKTKGTMPLVLWKFTRKKELTMIVCDKLQFLNTQIQNLRIVVGASLTLFKLKF